MYSNLRCLNKLEANLIASSSRCVSKVLSKNNKVKNFNEIPGPRSYPIIGTLHSYLPFIGDYKAEALHKNAMLNWKRYGPLVRESLMPGTNLLHVYDPEDIEAVFRQEGRLPSRRSHLAMFHYRMNKPDVYNTGGLLATLDDKRDLMKILYEQYIHNKSEVKEKLIYLRDSGRNGPHWWRLRSKFQKNFTSPDSVRYHVSTTDQLVREFIDWIKNKRFSSDDDFLKYLNRLNLEVIGEIAFDEKFNSFSDEEQSPNSRSATIISAAFYSNSGIMKLDKGFLWKLFNTPLYKKLVEAQTILESVSKQILIKKAKYFEKSEQEQQIKSLLDSFLQQPDVDIKDITGMMVDILMAGIDTTSYSTSFALYHLARNRECQEKLHKEAITLLPQNTTNISADALSNATYLRCCVKETLRLNPVSIGVGRILQKDIILKGYLIPKDTVIVTQNMTSSRLPQFVKDPLKFCPQRWQRDSEMFGNIHPFLSLPFGFGPRSCIARRIAEQNMSIILLRLIRDFDVHWEGGELGIETLLINKPDQPIKLRLIPRAN